MENGNNELRPPKVEFETPEVDALAKALWEFDAKQSHTMTFSAYIGRILLWALAEEGVPKQPTSKERAEAGIQKSFARSKDPSGPGKTIDANR